MPALVVEVSKSAQEQLTKNAERCHCAVEVSDTSLCEDSVLVEISSEFGADLLQLVSCFKLTTGTGLIVEGRI